MHDHQRGLVSPRIYYSPYNSDALASIADQLRAVAADGAETWCIFDNTAAFAATGNALSVRDPVQGRS